MKNNLKKLLCAALSTAMIAGSIVLPMTASAAEYTPLVEGDNVLKEWKFSFGTTKKDGYTDVATDRNVIKSFPLTYHRITNSNFRYCSTRQSRS